MAFNRSVSAGADLGAALVALRFCQSIDNTGRRLQSRERAFGFGGERYERQVRNWELAATRFKSVLLRIAEFHLKAGFDPNQPRWPAGNGRVSGRWSGGAGGVWEFSAVRRRRLGSKPDGHHFVHHSLYSKLPLSEEARKVFAEAKTGRLRGSLHGNSREHLQYNEAVKQIFDRYIADNHIRYEVMTAAQAREVVDLVMKSKDPRIYHFNLRILRSEVFYWSRRMPRAND